MMEWRDEGIVLAAKPHGESAALLTLFAAREGRFSGIVRGGTSQRMSPHLQPGGQVAAVWKARLGSHIGSFTIEPIRSRAALYSDAPALAALSSSAALLQLLLPERAPHPQLWQQSLSLLDQLGRPGWQSAYLRWECQLLEQSGYGLDLTSCAVTGSSDDLAYVSPRTGRAVSRAGAGDWAGRLLILPPALAGGTGIPAADLPLALQLTGHFLARALAESGQSRPLPEARQRLAGYFARAAGGS
ncbi:DNA repair protein RecO [Pseudogemmobacter faecipullorum]|uniref:DNA repair protein RecO n=1 Tax=Pseudogemmobacter faecipullorum TaxID=2755041 RepID=A0ABS8CGW2_9RHOB|nr:DNA repair protein RecO [Pseudogemmobacter faecipullorum]MCB5408621.1 DNA repair protein RecO [Pseudogemmobacter faecipullorum]